MLTPTLNIIGVIFAFGLSFCAYIFLSVNPDEYFFLPIYLLIFYYTVWAIVTEKKRYPVRPALLAVKKAFGKYLFWLALISWLYLFYGIHPYYFENAKYTRVMIENFLWLFAMGGFPYFFLVERYRYSRYEMVNDPYLRVLSLVHVLWNSDWRKLRYRIFKRGYKNLFLAKALRLHYISIMVEQVHGNLIETVAILGSPYYEYTIGGIAYLATKILFSIDSTNAAIGYFWESTITGTRFREMDPHPTHWFFVLVCYPPFIYFARTFAPFPEGVGAQPLLAGTAFQIAVNVLTIISLAGMVYVTTSLGFSYSNLSYKRIQTKGLYALVRHPGTVCKLCFFFFTIFRYRGSFNATTLALYGIWFFIYIKRALCEERFLKRFREYREYMAKVRYRFIPGVI
jgi:protein-S-isoprenylcysteine O-methyltransferase Ste14